MSMLPCCFCCNIWHLAAIRLTLYLQSESRMPVKVSCCNKYLYFSRTRIHIHVVIDLLGIFWMPHLKLAFMGPPSGLNSSPDKRDPQLLTNYSIWLTRCEMIGAVSKNKSYATHIPDVVQRFLNACLKQLPWSSKTRAPIEGGGRAGRG